MDSSSSSPESGRFKWYVLLVVLLTFGLSSAYTWAALNYTYSEGERAGYARKLSRRGWLCKTWEGELAMANQPGSQESLWFYTVRDESIIGKIKAHALPRLRHSTGGRPLSRHYVRQPRRVRTNTSD